MSAIKHKPCQCCWHSCGAFHGLADDCPYPAAGTWTTPWGEKFNLCLDCRDSDESGAIPADQWTPFADEVVKDAERIALEIVAEYKRGERR